MKAKLRLNGSLFARFRSSLKVNSAQNSSGPNVQYHQQSFIAHLISVAVDVVYVSC